MLLQSLQRYSGTIVFVSHDRHFVDHLATRVLEIGNGEVVSWPGNYEAFLQAKARVGDAGHQELRVEHRQAPVSAALTGTADRKQAYEDRKEAQKAQLRRERRLTEAQGRIEIVEGQLREVETAMADPALYQDAALWREASERHTALEADVAKAWAAWEAIDAETCL